MKKVTFINEVILWQEVALDLMLEEEKFWEKR